jgi:hypothetical protein
MFWIFSVLKREVVRGDLYCIYTMYLPKSMNLGLNMIDVFMGSTYLGRLLCPLS